MNNEVRQFLFVMVGIAAIAGAAWHVLIDPMAVALEADRARLVAWTQEIERVSRERASAEIDPAEVVRGLERDAERYRELWSIGVDAPRLYEIIENLAANAGVRIDRLEPRVSVNGREGSLILLKEVELDSFAEHTAYRIDCLGTFDAITRFVDAVQRETGLTRIRSVHYVEARTGDPEAPVRATINTLHVSLLGSLDSVSAAAETDIAAGEGGGE